MCNYVQTERFNLNAKAGEWRSGKLRIDEDGGKVAMVGRCDE